jgi:hypothetical protein
MPYARKGLLGNEKTIETIGWIIDVPLQIFDAATLTAWF